MKNKFGLCFRPVVVETEDSVSVLPRHDHVVSYDDHSIVPDANLNPSQTRKRKNRKIFRRKGGVAFKQFPSLVKAIVFHDPLKNIQQLELQLNSAKGHIKNRKCHKVPETITESEENQTGDQKTLISPTTSEESKSSCDKKGNTKSTNEKQGNCVSFDNLIVFVLLATVLLGPIKATVLVTLCLSFVRRSYGVSRGRLEWIKSKAAADPRKSYNNDKDCRC